MWKKCVTFAKLFSIFASPNSVIAMRLGQERFNGLQGMGWPPVGSCWVGKDCLQGWKFYLQKNNIGHHNWHGFGSVGRWKSITAN
jgi:hypothetical protein